MNQRCESCFSCGMPLTQASDFALSDETSTFCTYCVDKEGKLLPFDSILKSNAGYYQESQGLSEQAALKMAKDLLVSMPAWKNAGV